MTQFFLPSLLSQVAEIPGYLKVLPSYTSLSSLFFTGIFPPINLPCIFNPILMFLSHRTQKRCTMEVRKQCNMTSLKWGGKNPANLELVNSKNIFVKQSKENLLPAAHH